MRYKINTVGMALEFEGPATVEEYNSLAGEDRCCQDAVLSLLRTNILPRWQRDFVPTLEEASGQKKANTETFKSYVLRISPGLSDEVRQDLTSKAQALALAAGYYITPGEMVRAPKKEYLDKAAAMLAGDPVTCEAKIAELLKSVPGFQLLRTSEDNKPDQVSLAQLIGAWLNS